MQSVPRKAGQHGFTLLELLIAVFLLAVGLLAVATMQATAINANSIGNKHTAVASLAQEAMEDILSWNPDPTKEPRFAADSAGIYDLDPLTGSNTLNIASVGTCTASYSIDRDPRIPPITGAEVPWFVKIEVTVASGSPGSSGSVKTTTIRSYKQLRQP